MGHSSVSIHPCIIDSCKETVEITYLVLECGRNLEVLELFCIEWLSGFEVVKEVVGTKHLVTSSEEHLRIVPVLLFLLVT